MSIKYTPKDFFLPKYVIYNIQLYVPLKYVVFQYNILFCNYSIIKLFYGWVWLNLGLWYANPISCIEI